MIAKQTLAEIDSWSIEDRLELVHAVWDSIVEERKVPPLTDDLRTLLEERLAEDEADPNDVITWEEMQAELAVECTVQP